MNEIGAISSSIIGGDDWWLAVIKLVWSMRILASWLALASSLDFETVIMEATMWKEPSSAENITYSVMESSVYQASGLMANK